MDTGKAPEIYELLTRSERSACLRKWLTTDSGQLFVQQQKQGGKKEADVREAFKATKEYFCVRTPDIINAIDESWNKKRKGGRSSV